MTYPATDATFPDGLTPSMLALYEAEWREFTAWCAQRRLAALPADGETVTEFARWYAFEWTPDGRPALPGQPAGKSAVSVKRALLAISAAHREAGQRRPDTRDAYAIVAERRGLGSPRGPGRPRLDAPRAAPPDALTEARDTALALLATEGDVSAQWLAALRVDDVALGATWVEMTRHGVGRTVTSGRVAAAVADWLELMDAEGVTGGPLFPRIRKGEPAGEPLLAGEIAVIVREQAA